jgi:hypothetical protein
LTTGIFCVLLNSKGKEFLKLGANIKRYLRNMLPKKNLIAFCTVLLLFLFIACSCAGRYLTTESAKPMEITGTYDLILYGGNYLNDKKTLAILVRKDEPYRFDIYAPDFDYRTIKDVPASKALGTAKKFVSFHHAFWKIQLSKIIDKGGKTIGYEVRPLYYPEVYGEPDVLDVYYRQTDGKVVVYIRLTHHRMESYPFEGGRMGVGTR